MSDTIDIQDPQSCRKYATVKEVVLPGIGYHLKPRAAFLMDQNMRVAVPATMAETQQIYEELRQASVALNKLKRLPEGWDRTNVENLMSWLTGIFKKALDEKRGLQVSCGGLEILPRLEPSITASTINPAEIKALLHRFDLNRQGKDWQSYLGGEIIAGKYRPKANKLIILLSDFHMSSETQRNILRAVWNLQKDGVKLVGLEMPPHKISELLRDQSVRHMMTAGLAESLAKTLEEYEKTASFIKAKMEESPPQWEMFSFYPAMARMMVMAALVGKTGLIGVDDDKLLKDINMTCHADEWSRAAHVTLSEAEKNILWEACLRYGIELRSHLAIREFVRHVGPPTKREVMVLPFGSGHIMSLLGELLKPAYKNYSYLVVIPDGVLNDHSDKLRWLYQIRNRSSRQFQIQPLLQDRQKQRFPGIQPVK